MFAQPGRAILVVYGRDDFAVERKSDHSPLTEADRAAHRLISSALAKLDAAVPILSEEAAEYAATMRKPVAAFIAGRASPPGRKMGHAGAIVSGGRGDYASKRRALEIAGVAVADVPSQLPTLLRERPG